MNKNVASLLILEPGNTKSISLEEKSNWLMGRKCSDMKQDITLISANVSRKHGQFVHMDDGWYYIDLDSMNGSYCNDVRVTASEKGRPHMVKLKNGDIIRLGSAVGSGSMDSKGASVIFFSAEVSPSWRAYPLKKDTIYIGRTREKCDIVIPLPYISGQHAAILRRETGYFLKDCDSMAGTWLNNRQLSGEVQLKERDIITICDCTMVFSEKNILLSLPPHNAEMEKSSKDNTNTVAYGKSINVKSTGADSRQKPIILKANIISRKVPNNTGRGEKELIRDVRVEVQKSTLVALLGGAGAGKSTVMNCMNGMETAGMTGTVEYNGVDLLKNFDRMKYLIGSVPQMETFHETLTVEQELTHAARHRLPSDTTKAEIKERVDDTLKQLGIENIRKNRISKCSGGEKRRVNIGIELVADRQLLCLDEPDAGLDPGNKRKLFEILRSLAHKEGKSILTIIHDVSDIDLFDKIIIMNKVDNVGRLAFAGTPEEARKYFGVDIKDVYQLMAKNPKEYIWKDKA